VISAEGFDSRLILGLYYTPQLQRNLIANGMELRIDDTSRTSLTRLSLLLRNTMFIFTPMNPVESILGRRHVPAGITRLYSVFTRHLRGNHVWYTYGNILKSAYFNASIAIGIIADTINACKMISQSRHIPVPYLYITVNVFPPRNRVRDLSFSNFISKFQGFLLNLRGRGVSALITHTTPQSN